MHKSTFKYSLIVSCVISTVFLASYSLAHAQGIPGIEGLGGYDNLPAIPSGSITLELSTSYPKPRQTIRATALSYSTDLNRATVRWFINGKMVAEGRGLTTYSFTAAPFGTTQTILVRATTPEGTTLESSQTLRSAEVDLIWQADSYVPPFYKGKALYPYQGSLTVAAIPHFSETPTNPKNYVYKWRINGSAYDNVSGYGKDSVDVTGSVIARPISVEVTVSNLDGTISAYKQITISGQNPEVAYYEESQLYGPLFNRMLVNFELKNKEIMLRAVPYYFSIAAPHTSPAVAYNWQINRTPVVAQNNGTNNLLLRKPEGASGRSDISLKVTNPHQILQGADTKTTIYFTTQ